MRAFRFCAWAVMVAIPALWFSVPVCAATGFSGRWVADIRTPDERKVGADCGEAKFDLKQSGEKISGSFTLATANCGRLNEGGDKTVSGVVVGNTMVLVVTSGRNGETVIGKATMRGDRLIWKIIDTIKDGGPGESSDAGLILTKGVFKRAK